MITQIKEWGNSQGLRLKKHLLTDVGISVGDDVEVTAQNGVIMISPAKASRKKYSLQKLVASIPEEYKVSEVGWSKPVGREAW